MEFFLCFGEEDAMRNALSKQVVSLGSVFCVLIFWVLLPIPVWAGVSSGTGSPSQRHIVRR
jgi:hypothetical protein